jgi:hypothetical protein
VRAVVNATHVRRPDLHDDSLSTDRRQSGILVNVHPVLLWNTEALQLILL